MLVYVDEASAGARLDAFLAKAVPGLTRSAAQTLIEKGMAADGSGAALKKNYIVKAGDTLSLTVPEASPADALPQDIPLDVAYEDGDVIVVNKPKGLVVHPAPGHPDGTLVNALLFHCGSSLSGVGGQLRPGIVHRLDMDTSGLMIAAKNDAAHLSLSAQLKDRSLSRVYEAIVIGRMRERSGTVDAPIGRSPGDRKKMAVTDKSSRPAVTHWELLEELTGYSYVRCRLQTGRTHQIRVHMAYIGHPVLGDPLYGGARKSAGVDSQCLHAREISFIHPRTGEKMTFTSPLPEYFTALLEKLRGG